MSFANPTHPFRLLRHNRDTPTDDLVRVLAASSAAPLLDCKAAQDGSKAKVGAGYGSFFEFGDAQSWVLCRNGPWQARLQHSSKLW